MVEKILAKILSKGRVRSAYILTKEQEETFDMYKPGCLDEYIAKYLSESISKEVVDSGLCNVSKEYIDSGAEYKIDLTVINTSDFNEILRYFVETQQIKKYK